MVGISRFKKNLERYGINNKLFEKERLELSKKFGKDPSEEDVIWSIFNQLIIRFADNLQELKMIYYEMALFLNEEGRDSFQMGEMSRKMELLLLKKQGIKKVKILGTNGCEKCRKQNGKSYSISTALKTMPLPNKECTYHLNNDKYGFCRCCWVAVFDID